MSQGKAGTERWAAARVAALELGRDTGIALAETWILTPLGSATLAGVLGLAVALAARRRRA